MRIDSFEVRCGPSTDEALTLRATVWRTDTSDDRLVAARMQLFAPSGEAFASVDVEDVLVMRDAYVSISARSDTYGPGRVCELCEAGGGRLEAQVTVTSPSGPMHAAVPADPSCAFVP